MEQLSFDIFQWMGADAQKAFVRSATVVQKPAGTLVYAEGDPGRSMYRLVSGAVRMSVLRDDGRELLFQIYRPGGCFGVSSIVDGGDRPQTAEAYEDSEIQLLTKSAADQLRGTYPDFNDALLRLLSMNMRLLIDYFAGSNLDPILAWLAQRLEEAGRAFGHATNEGILLGKPISQTELAAMVGSSRQTVNKALAELKRLGLIDSRGGNLLLRDVRGLQLLAHRGIEGN